MKSKSINTILFYFRPFNQSNFELWIKEMKEKGEKFDEEIEEFEEIKRLE